MSDNIEVVRLWQLPDDFFSLPREDQWIAIKKITSKASIVKKPRAPCAIALRDDALAISFFLVTLCLPLLLLGLVGASVYNGSLLHLIGSILLSTFLAIHPMPKGDWRRSRLALALIRYFTMEVLVDRDDPRTSKMLTSEVDNPDFVEKNIPILCIACPHGVFSYGSFSWCSMSPFFVGHEQYTAAAAVVKYVPGLRYMDQLICAVDADRKTIKNILQRRFGTNQSGWRRGGMLGLVPDGILGAFRCQPGVDELVIGKRRGLMRICAEEGATVFTGWFFGTTDMLTVVQDPFGIMETVSRKLQAGMLLCYGRWYLPIPRRIAVTLSYDFYQIKEKNASPTQEELNKLHDEVYGGLKRVHEKHKIYAGYPDRTLIVT